MATEAPEVLNVESGTYLINEIFYSLQGEGLRAGSANVFVRFAKCNLKCEVEPGPKSPGGFDCDTEFESGNRMPLEEIHGFILGVLEAQGAPPPAPSVIGGRRWLILTGGEPALQLDQAFCDYFRQEGFALAVETNGSMLLPLNRLAQEEDLAREDLSVEDQLALFAVDWITVSPKVAEHAIRQRWAHEVKYVRGLGQAMPQTRVQALHRLISPAFDGLETAPQTVEWCIDLVKRHPNWQLSVQLHKLWNVR
jgi:organic radical activating enzyme